jgi:hypothetical protein
MNETGRTHRFVAFSLLQGLIIKDGLPDDFDFGAAHFISTASSSFMDSLSLESRLGIGGLDVQTFKLGSPFAYWRGEWPGLESTENCLSLLTLFMSTLSHFLSSMWLYRDNAVCFDSAFLVCDQGATEERITKNSFSAVRSTCEGSLESVAFTRTELSQLSLLFRGLLLPLVDEDEERINTDGNQNPGSANAIKTISIKGPSLISRLNYFIDCARTTCDLGVKVVHYTTCLESVLSSGSGEISHKVAERLAFLFGKDTEDRIEVYNQMMRAYDVRSKIVHGDTVNPKSLSDLPAIVRFVDKMARGVLLMLLQKPHMRKMCEKKNDAYKELFLKILMADRGPASG